MRSCTTSWPQCPHSTAHLSIKWLDYEAGVPAPFGYPNLARSLVKSIPDLSIDPIKLIEIDGDVRDKLGFLLAEQLDFGSSRKINLLYSSLLKLTPFSKDEAEQFSNILRDRNLLVHHGGVYTSSYLRQLAVAPPNKSLPFYDSKRTSLEEVNSLLDFVESIARKILKASKAALADAVKDEAEFRNARALELLDYDFD
jgi:uncharacterized protein YydD (DUF2326 family)